MFSLYGEIKQASTLTSHGAELNSSACGQMDRKYGNLEYVEYDCR
jgi:hypothetical protein